MPKRSRLSRKIIRVKRSELSKHRMHWEKIAKDNNWRKEFGKFFPIQVWVNRDGTIRDSVAHLGLDKKRKTDLMLIPKSYDDVEVVDDA